MDNMTKFDRYKSAYLKLADELKCLDNDVIQGLLKSWNISFNEMDDFLISKEITKSKMTSGLLQGLRDLPSVFSDLPAPISELATSKYKRVISEIAPELI